MKTSHRWKRILQPSEGAGLGVAVRGEITADQIMPVGKITTVVLPAIMLEAVATNMAETRI